MAHHWAISRRDAPLESFRMPSPPLRRPDTPPSPKAAVLADEPRIRAASHSEERLAELHGLRAGLESQSVQLQQECDGLVRRLQQAERSRNTLRSEVEGRELQQVVKSLEQIDRKELDEIVSYASPPKAVRDVLEAVYLILHCCRKGCTAANWVAAKEMVTRRTFKSKLLNFDTSVLLMAFPQLLLSIQQKIHFAGIAPVRHCGQYIFSPFFFRRFFLSGDGTIFVFVEPDLN